MNRTEYPQPFHSSCAYVSVQHHGCGGSRHVISISRPTERAWPTCEWVVPFRLHVVRCADERHTVSDGVTNTGIAVSNGLFAVTLDFGVRSIYLGESRWLEVLVQSSGATDFTQLSPRQPIGVAPYALFAPNAGIAAPPEKVQVESRRESGGRCVPWACGQTSPVT